MANEIQTITFDGTPAGGSFKIAFSGHTTAAIPGSSLSGSAVQDALWLLPSIGEGNVLVDLTSNVLTLTFQNDLGNQPLPEVTVEDNVLVTSASNKTASLELSSEIQTTSDYTLWNMTPSGDTIAENVNNVVRVQFGSVDGYWFANSDANVPGHIDIDTAAVAINFTDKDSNDWETEILASVGASVTITVSGNVVDPVDAVVATTQNGTGPQFPGVNRVRSGIKYGPDGDNFTGDLTLPSSGLVFLGTQYGGNSGSEFTGGMVLPDESDVRNLIEYGGGNQERTGTLIVPTGGGSGAAFNGGFN